MPVVIKVTTEQLNILYECAFAIIFFFSFSLLPPRRFSSERAFSHGMEEIGEEGRKEREGGEPARAGNKEEGEEEEEEQA